MQAAKGRIERSALYCRATSNACSDGHAEDIGLNSSALVTSNVDPQVAAEKDRASQPSLHSGKIAFCIKLPDAFHQAISSVAKAESSLIFSKTATGFCLSVLKGGHGVEKHVLFGSGMRLVPESSLSDKTAVTRIYEKLGLEVSEQVHSKTTILNECSHLVGKFEVQIENINGEALRLHSDRILAEKQARQIIQTDEVLSLKRNPRVKIKSKSIKNSFSRQNMVNLFDNFTSTSLGSSRLVPPLATLDPEEIVVGARGKMPRLEYTQLPLNDGDWDSLKSNVTPSKRASLEPNGCATSSSNTSTLDAAILQLPKDPLVDEYNEKANIYTSKRNQLLGMISGLESLKESILSSTDPTCRENHLVEFRRRKAILDDLTADLRSRKDELSRLSTNLRK